MDIHFVELGEGLVHVIDVVAVGVILLGLIKTLWIYAKAEYDMIRKNKSYDNFHKVRKEIASYLLLSLELVVAADIIHTIITPTLDNLYVLGLLVVIRTAIAYYLEREMKEFEKKGDKKKKDEEERKNKEKNGGKDDKDNKDGKDKDDKKD